MSTRMVIDSGNATMVYDDRWRPILDALGSLTVERATRLEFEESSGEWVATHIASGLEIGRGPNRSELIKTEVAWLEANVIGAKGV